MTGFRTDRNRNPTAFTTDVARLAGLAIDKDYEAGDPFTVPGTNGPITYFTAKLLGDPIEITIRAINAVTYYTLRGGQRWTYIAIPKFIWDDLTPNQKKQVIGFQYQHEGGTEMKGLFS